MIRHLRALVLTAGLAVALVSPALAATPSQAFNCTVGYSDSVATLGALSRIGQDNGAEADYDWVSTKYAPSDFAVFGYTPVQLEYYWEEDDLGSSDGFLTLIAAPLDEVRAAALRRLGVSSCTRYSNDGKTCVISRGASLPQIEIMTNGAYTEIGCWFED